MTKFTSYRPVEGRRARRPNGEPLPDTGMPLVLTPYWRSLLNAGDIEPVPVVKSKPRSTSE